MPVFVAFDWFGVAGGGDAGSFTTDPTDPAAGGTGGTPPALPPPGEVLQPVLPPPLPGPPQQPAEQWCACCPGACDLVNRLDGSSRVGIRIENISSDFYGPIDPFISHLHLRHDVEGTWHQVQNMRCTAGNCLKRGWSGETETGGFKTCVYLEYALGADCNSAGQVVVTFYYMPTATYADSSATCRNIAFQLPEDDGPPYFVSEEVASIKVVFPHSAAEGCTGTRLINVPVRWTDPVTSTERNETFALALTLAFRNDQFNPWPTCATTGTGPRDPENDPCVCAPGDPEPQPPPDPGPRCVQTDCCPNCVPEFLCWVGTGDGCAFGLVTLQYFDSIDAWHGTYTATGGGTISVRVWCDDASNTWRANLHCGGELIGTYTYNTTLSTCDPLSLVFDGNLAGGNGCCPTPVVGARGTVTPGECGGGPGPDECEGLPDTLYMIPQYNDDVGGCPGPVNCEGGSDDGVAFPLTKQGSDAGCCVWISEDFFQSSDTWYFEVRRCTTDVCPGTPPKSRWRVQIKLRTGNGSILNSVSCHARWNVETCFDSVTETPGILMSYTTDCGTFTVTDTPPP